MEGETGIRSRERKGWYKQEGEGDGKARTPTRATFSRSFLRSFVRFFVMTVDETMTYFPGFYSRGAPRLCHSHLPSHLSPVPPLSSGTHAHTRRRLECILSSSFHCVGKSCAFSFCMARVIPRTSLPLNSFLGSDLYVKRVNILAIVAE